MADFKETLDISRMKLAGKPSAFPWYCYVHTKEDLSDGSLSFVGFGEYLTIGDCCKLIDEFSPCEKVSKLAIQLFLKTDKYNSSEEY